MLDQDLVFTYNRDLDPWYRIPVGIANHAIVGAALIGIAILVVRARRDRAYAFAAGAVIAYVVSHIALHATSTVEMRFGLPLLLLAGPAAIAVVGEVARVRSKWLLPLAIAVLGYTAAK